VQVTLETAAFSDAVQKASRVAPVKGAAFDKAQGIVVEYDPISADRPIVVKATDLESTFVARLPAVEAVGAAGSWRMPSNVIAGFLSNLPMSAGQPVKLEAKDDVLLLRAGRTKCRLRTIPGDTFPRFDEFDSTGLEVVTNLAQRVQQVAWACQHDAGVLAGVHIDGERLVGCDKVKLAEVPCAVPVETPITVPLQALSGVMKNTAEVRMRATAEHLQLMTDDDTQATSVIYADPYPNVAGLRAAADRHPHAITIGVEPLMQVLQRQMVLCKGERYPAVKLTFSDGAFAVEMDVPELGAIEDELDCDGGSTTSMEMWFTPTILLGALQVAKAPSVTISYAEPLKPLSVSDGTGYRCLAMPLNRTAA